MKLTDKIRGFAESFKSYIENSERKNLILIGFLLGFALLFILSYSIYIANTEIVPASGGTYSEGFLGTPRFINPIYSQNSEVDGDLTEILFAGLMKYDEKNELVPHLAESVQGEGGRVFDVKLREDAYWSDGEKITADDVIFTVETIQSRSIQSPLRVSWEGISIEKLSETEVRFRLEAPSPLFIEKLTLKPIPKHLWEDVTPDDFQFSEHNLNPVTSGAYKVKKADRESVESITLEKNPHYFGEKPYIDTLEFHFFKSEEELISNKSELGGFALPSIKNEVNTSFEEYSFHLPRYFAIFFNLNHFDEEVRKALAYGTDKDSILSLLEKVEEANSPIIPSFYGLSEPEVIYEYDPEKAESLLKEEGYERGDQYFEKIIREERSFEFTERLREDDQGEEVRELQRCLIELTEEHEDLFPEEEITGYLDEDTKEAVNRFQVLFREDILDPHNFENPTGIVASSTRAKLNELCGGVVPEEKEVLSVEITTIDHPLLTEVVEEITDKWEELGVKVKKRPVDLQVVESDILENKDFEAFLFGISMEAIPDPFRWWHSSQTDRPGLNFTNYRNEEADEFLEDAVTLLDKTEREKALENFQNRLLEDKPAIFIYSPHYLYLVDNKIKGISEGKIINSSQRFKNLNNWYINTKRVWENN